MTAKAAFSKGPGRRFGRTLDYMSSTARAPIRTHEHGAFIKYWQTLRPFDTAVRRAFQGSGWRVSDAAAIKMDKRFAAANTHKRCYGNGSVNIRTNADD